MATHVQASGRARATPHTAPPRMERYIEPGNENARRRQAEMMAQVVTDDAQRIDDAVDGERRRDILQRQMCRRKRDAQRTLPGAGEHHDDMRRMRARGPHARPDVQGSDR